MIFVTTFQRTDNIKHKPALFVKFTPMPRHLHIVSFNVPYPADYGGVIDVFYRLKALSEAGIAVHLHCFAYGRKPAPELARLCHEVHYYRRDTSPLRLMGRRPYIVSSRSSDELCRRLQQDDHPILLEGIHCCDVLEREAFRSRTVMVRAHNVEADYYRLLARAEHSPLRRLYLADEARKLRRYESVLQRASAVFAISDADAQTLTAAGVHGVQVVTASHPFERVVSQVGQSDYALFHGNLAVAENYRAALLLAEGLFADGRLHFVVAGNHPPQWLRRRLAKYSNITLVDTPDDAAMQRLVADAQVILLHTAQPTGLKLKLLHSLFAGRHCLVNSAMVTGTPLAPLCTVADDMGAMRHELDRLMHTGFTEDMLSVRSAQLEPLLTSRTIVPILEMI